MNVMIMATMESPALNGVSDHWPERYDRVPKRIRMIKTIKPSCARAPIDRRLKGLALVAGQQYWVLVNSHGAVSAIVSSCTRIGVRPDEFEVVEFHDAPLIRQAKIKGSSPAVGIKFRCMFCGKEFDTVEACNVCEESH